MFSLQRRSFSLTRGVTACAAFALASPAAIAQIREKLVWTQEANAGPLLRGHAVLVFDSQRGVSVLFGGANYHVRLNDTWEWDGRNWRESPKASDIPGLWCANGAYDSKRGKVVVCGGAASGGGKNSATYEFDGTGWIQVATDGPEVFNYVGQMAYDSRRGRTVLFGGASFVPVKGGFEGGPPMRDTWEWDGKTWYKVTSDGPPPSAGHGMAFDAARDVTVMLIAGDEKHEFGQTWEWDGKSWRLATESGPTQRIAGYLRLAYDSDRKVVIGVGGDPNVPRPEVETWEWNGIEWKEQILDPEPNPKGINHVCYDSLRKKLVMFGGYCEKPEGVEGEVWQLGQ